MGLPQQVIKRCKPDNWQLPPDSRTSPDPSLQEADLLTRPPSKASPQMAAAGPGGGDAGALRPRVGSSHPGDDGAGDASQLQP